MQHFYNNLTHCNILLQSVKYLFVSSNDNSKLFYIEKHPLNKKWEKRGNINKIYIQLKLF